MAATKQQLDSNIIFYVQTRRAGKFIKKVSI